MRNIAKKNQAVYIENSLQMTPNGKHAEAQFETVEPDPDSPATKLHRLGIDLDASVISLYINPALWADLYPTLAER
jgi:hypothetical protein